MYKLRRSPDGLLHGPIDKKVWASYAGRAAAAQWARRQATRWGFPPDTNKVVQIVMDGAKGLKQNFQGLFPHGHPYPRYPPRGRKALEGRPGFLSRR